MRSITLTPSLHKHTPHTHTYTQNKQITDSDSLFIKVEAGWTGIMFSLFLLFLKGPFHANFMTVQASTDVKLSTYLEKNVERDSRS